MTTKTEVKIRPAPDKKIKSGDLLQSNTGSGLIVMITSKEHKEYIFSGVVMHKGDSIYSIGDFDESWSVSCFDIFNGTLTLSSE